MAEINVPLSLSTEQIAKRIARRRKQLGLSLRDAAELCGVDHTALWRSEKGREPRRGTFLRILRGLGLGDQ